MTYFYVFLKRKKNIVLIKIKRLGICQSKFDVALLGDKKNAMKKNFGLMRLPTAAPRNTEQHSSRPCALNQSKANFFLLLSLHLLFHLFFLFAIKQLGGRPYQNLH